VKERFFEDLEILHGRTGPWDVLLFSGDFVQRGSQEEFAGLEEQLLGPLWSKMKELGSQPQLLGVPGNHDLERPKTLNKPTAALRMLLRTDGFAQVADDLFDDFNGEYCKLVDEAFANYVAWGHIRRGNRVRRECAETLERPCAAA
jgi:Calcineurin-like phosphoesterase